MGPKERVDLAHDLLSLALVEHVDHLERQGRVGRQVARPDDRATAAAPQDRAAPLEFVRDDTEGASSAAHDDARGRDGVFALDVGVGAHDERIVEIHEQRGKRWQRWTMLGGHCSLPRESRTDGHDVSS